MIDSSFLFQIILSCVVGSLWVLLTTLLADRFGSKLGGFIGGLPSTAAVSFFFIGGKKTGGETRLPAGSGGRGYAGVRETHNNIHKQGHCSDAATVLINLAQSVERSQTGVSSYKGYRRLELNMQGSATCKGRTSYPCTCGA